MAKKETVVIEFTGETGDLIKELNKVNDALERQEELARLTEQGLEKIGITSGLIATGIAAVGVQATQTGIEFERLQTALATSLGSQSEAEAAFEGILQFAKETPFQVQEITEAFVKLQNQGIDPSADNLRRLGDIAASQGKSFEQITEAILDAAQGEGERLKEFGIRASFAGEQAQIAFKDVNLEVAKTPEAIAEAVLSLGELEGVAGGMEAQSKTLGGALSNLGDNADQVALAFFELSGDAVKSVVDSANGLLSGFLELDPAVQKLVFGVAGLTAAVSASVAVIAAYNIAVTSQVALQLKAAAATLNSTLTMKGLAAATTGAATATGGLIAVMGPLLAKLALIVAAGETLRQVYLSAFGDGGEAFRQGTNNLRENLLELEAQTESTSEVLQKELPPARRSWVDFFGTRATKEVNQARIAVRDFRGAIGGTIEAAQDLGDSAEDTALKQKLFADAQEELNNQIAALDEEQLGTEAYRELRSELEVSQNELTQWQGILLGTGDAVDASTGAIASQTGSIEEQTQSIEDLVAAEEELNEARIRQDERDFEDETNAADAAREDERRRNAEDVQNIIDQRTRKREARLVEQRRRREDEAAARKIALEEQISGIQQQSEAARESAKREAESRIQQAERDHTEFIENLKRDRQDERQESDRAFQEELDNRRAEQSEGFSGADTILDRQLQLLRAGSEEQRNALRKQFNQFDQIEARVSELNLADQIFNPDQLLDLAQQVAGVGRINTEEDAVRVQEALGQIQAEQQEQQAEADRIAQEERRLQQQEADRAFQAELLERERVFEEEQNARKLAAQQLDEQAAIATEEKITEIKRQFEQEKIAIERAQQDADRISAQEFEASIAETRALAQETERQLQADFEAEQLEKRRSFEDEQRALNEASAEKIAALQAQAAASVQASADALASASAPVTDVIPRFKGGPVEPGKIYLGGEIRPEPITFSGGRTAMVGLDGPQLFKVSERGVVHPSIGEFVQANIDTPRMASPTVNVSNNGSTALLSEIQALRADIRRSPNLPTNNTYNIQTPTDPLKATIKLQQEAIRLKARRGRL